MEWYWIFIFIVCGFGGLMAGYKFPEIKKSAKDWFVAVPFETTNHDQRCFDCNDGNDECRKYPNCQHINRIEARRMNEKTA